MRLTHAESARVSYDEDGAGVLELAAEADLSDMARAPVRVMCGYDGAHHEYFTGTLGRPVYDGRSGITDVEAYGVLGAMGRQYFEDPTTLQGISLRGFFGIISSLLYDSRVRIDVRSGGATIEDTVLPPEDSLREGAEAVVEAFDHVMRDRPGFGLLVHPRPRPQALGQYAAVFSAADYPVGQPKITPADGSGAGPYAKVVVHRRGEDGVEEIWAEAPVAVGSTYQPKPNEIYWVHDFDGDQAEAQSTAASTARALTIDAFAGELSGATPRSDLLQDSPVLFEVIDDDWRSPKDRRSQLRRHYAATITETELDLVAESFDVRFDALLVFEEEIPESTAPTAPSPYVVLAPDAVYATAFGEDAYGVFFRLESEEDYAGEDTQGLWVDPDLGGGEAAEEAGEDTGGLWVEVSS